MPQTPLQTNRQRLDSTRSHRFDGGLRETGRAPKRERRARCLRVDARPELRVEPDWDRFAWALLQYVRAQREKADQQARDEGAAR
jgi:hypothetical protein